jgi:uncharacterized protein YjbI with pentapeptide repeats
MIEVNGGPEGLDLSAYDLSSVNLARLNLQGIIFGRPPFVRSGRGATLNGAIFSDSDLTRADLAFTDLDGASFWQTTLYEATLSGARACNAQFGKADLRRADFYGSDLGGANLWYAKLQGANLGIARTSDAVITGAEFGDRILQEDEDTYAEYFDRWYVKVLPTQYKKMHLASRHREAAEVYMNLKNAYLSHGRYKEASQAYIRERQLNRMMHYPKNAEQYFTEDFARAQAVLSWHWWKFYLEHTIKWFLDWAAELSCGYGERPLRTVAWAAVILLMFPFLYAWSGGVETTTGPLSWIEYFNYSLGAFTTIGFAQFEATTPLAQTLTSMQALLGISILALLMFALGNRISRS